MENFDFQSDQDFQYFCKRLASAIAPMLIELTRNPPKDIYSQREAYRRFGCGNVRRWVKEGRLKPFAKRPGKIEYKRADLEALFNTEQDYLTHVISNKKKVKSYI